MRPPNVCWLLVKNLTKSQVVVFNHKYRQRLSDLILCNTPVPYQTEATHLGLKIGPDAARANLTQAICVLNTQCNMILCNYSHCRFDTLRHLFKTYCCSFYGCPLWDLDVTSIAPLCIAWRKCVRRLFRLPYCTRSKYIHHLFNDPDLHIQPLARCIKFINSCVNSSNSIVHFCFSIISHSTSIIASNLRCIKKLTDIPFDKAKFIQKWWASHDVSAAAEANVIV
jgi:hypothetical protein